MNTFKKLLTGFLFLSVLPLVFNFLLGVAVQKETLEDFQHIAGKIMPGNIALTRMTAELYHTVILASEYELSRKDEDRNALEKAMASLASYYTMHDVYYHTNDLQHNYADNTVNKISILISEYMLLISNSAPQEKLDKMKLLIHGELNNFIARTAPFIEQETLVSLSKSEEMRQKNRKVTQLLIGVGATVLLFAIMFSLFIFNQFKKINMALDESRQNLQKLVKKRTRQLEESNMALQAEVVERKQAESVALKEKENAQKYLDIAGVMFCALDKDGNITLINQKGCDLLQVSETEALTQNWFDRFLPERISAEVKGVFQQLMAGKIEPVEYYENAVLVSSGEERIMAFHNTLLINTGEIEGILFSGEDITDRVTAENKLKKAISIIDNSPAVVFRWRNSDDWPVEYVSSNAAKIFGYTAEDFISGNVLYFSIIHPDDLKAVAAEVASNSKSSTKDFIQAPYRIITKDGSVKWLEVKTNIVRDENGSIAYFEGIIQDISLKVEAEEKTEAMEKKLQQAQKMEAIGTLAGGIAHDFNNILAIILGYAGLVKNEVAPGSVFEDYLDKVLIAADRAKDLVKQILAFSRQTQVKRFPLSIDSQVKEGLKMLRSSIPTTIKIISNIDRDCKPILADPTQVHQILMNLCTNAFHAMEETGGELSVKLKTVLVESQNQEMLMNLPAGEYVELIVSDTGSGIGPDIIDKIFDPYFTTKEIGKGTGMGLAIIHGIMEDYGGSVTVESELGKGTTFHVYFPAAQAEASLINNQENISISGGEERILFVDDEEFLVSMNKDLISRLGYHVTVCYNGVDALKIFEKNPADFDLIMTDQTMPGMTGSELARKVLQIRPEIPVILCSGYSNLIDEESAKQIGIREFALKPISINTMAGMIRKVLEESQALP